MELELVEYDRKTFTVKAVELTFKNVDVVAKWCKGKVSSETTRILGGADTELPVIKLQGQGEDRGKELTVRLGYFIVESKGRFRVYKAPQFWAAFEEKVVLKQVAGQPYEPEIDDETHESDCDKQHQGEGCACEDEQESDGVVIFDGPAGIDINA